MQKFVVTRYALGKHHEVSITEGQYRHAKTAFEQLHEIVLLEERFDAIAGGFLDFEKAMLASILEFAYAGFKDGLYQMSVRRQLNRLLMNALSAARGYIDHLPQACDSVFGREDARAGACRATLRESYDGLMGYRMFEALRNHAQHSGFPIHSVSYSHQGEGEAPYAQARLSLSPMVDTAELAQNRSFKKNILKEMKQLGARLDLKPYLREYMQGIATAHYLFREHAQTIAESSQQTLDELTNRFVAESGSDDTIALRAILSSEGQVVESVPLSADLSTYFQYLFSNNRLFDRSSDFYIASAGRC